MINLILCYPPQRNYAGYGQDRRWLPLGIASLAAYIDSKINKNTYNFVNITCLDLFDLDEQNSLNLIKKNLDSNHLNIVGFTMLTEQRISVVNLCNQLIFNNTFSKFKIKTLVGGVHATLLCNQIADNYNFIDHIICGEGEKGLEYLLDSYLNDCDVEKIINKGNIENISLLPHTIEGFKFFKTQLEIEEGAIVFSRGCTDYCNFSPQII